MGGAALLAIILLILIILLFVGLLIFSITRKSKIGITISSIILLFALSILLINNIAEITIGNEDVKNDLRLFNINLKDDFEIKSNDVSGMPERNQKTELIISRDDAQRIVQEIENSKNFKEFKNELEVSNFSYKYDNNQIFDYEYPEFYSRELEKEINNIPTRLFLYLDKKNFLLTYSKSEV